MENGFSLPPDDENRQKESLSYPGELWFDLKDLCVKPCHVVAIHDGDIFDLGGRTLRVIATPGHSKDGIMLADDDNQLLFTGDTVYPAPLYAFLEGADQVPVYVETIKSLAGQYSSYTLCCSHNNPIWEGCALSEISNAFEDVLAGHVKGIAQDGHTVYTFGDFSIVL